MSVLILSPSHGVVAEWQTQQTQNLPTLNRMGSSPISPTNDIIAPMDGGSSVGVSYVRGKCELNASISERIVIYK